MAPEDSFLRDASALSETHPGKDAPTAEDHDYGGIGRVVYLVLLIPCYCLVVVSGPHSLLGFVALPAAGAGAIWLSWLRLKNLAISRGWSLLVFIPFVQALLYVLCLMLPEGYGDHRTLDTAGKINVTVILVLGVVAVVGMALQLS